MEEDDFSPECCLFIANLPQEMTNESLAYALLEVFTSCLEQIVLPTDTPNVQQQLIKSVKASRDARGRPFGFIEFCQKEQAEAMLSYAQQSLIWMSSRRLRIEAARRQLRFKLHIPVRDQAIVWYELCMEIPASDLRFVAEEDGYMVLVVKFEPGRETALIRDWESRGWFVTRMSDSSSACTMRGNPLSMRSSGLVQLVLTPPLKKKVLAAPCEELNLFKPVEAISTAHGMHPGDIYVGRLNSRLATTACLAEHFGRHGKLVYVKLYNRMAVGLDGVPIDAHAFLRFEVQSAAEQAIQSENHQTWLGQIIKCEKARTSTRRNLSIEETAEEDETSSWTVID